MKTAYGRLDIFWPDGHLETFMLRDPQVTVGRAAGNTVVLNADGVDVNHLLLSPNGETVKLLSTASELETFVDGRSVSIGETADLRNGDEIQLGPLRVVFRGVDDAPTLPMRPGLDETQRIRTESYAFRVELQLPQISVTPGAYMSLELSVNNTGPDPEKYFIEVSGLPLDWLRVNRPALAVEPGESGLVLMNIRPNRHSSSQPGDYPVVVTVRPDRAPEAAVRTPLVVRVLPFAGFGVALSSRRLTGKAGFRIHLHNHGSAPVPVHLTAIDRAGALDIRLAQSTATLGPGQRLSVAGMVAPRDRRLFGAAAEIPFIVAVQSEILPHFTAAVAGTVVDKPPLPAWAKPALAVGALLAVLLVIFGAVGLFNQRAVTPVIEDFRVGDGVAEVPRGQPVSAQWDVRDAERLTLQVGSGEPVEVSGSPYEVPTDALAGTVVVRLTAYNGDQTAQSERLLTVYRPAVIDNIRVSPATVYRNVVQNFTISWEGSGFADGVRLRGLDTLGQPVEVVSADEIGSFSFAALPQSNFTVRLLAVDERGIAFERTLDVVLADPQCTVNRPDVPLLTAPFEGASVREVLDQGVSRTVTGRSADGTFLLVRLVDNTEAWARLADLTCPSNQFNINDLRVVVVQPPADLPPTPTNAPPPVTVFPSMTPSLTPTLTPTLTLAPFIMATATPAP